MQSKFQFPNNKFQMVQFLHWKLRIGNLKFSRGFTITELVIALGVMGILVGIITINLVNIQHTTSLGTAVSQVSADMHEQQLKAMIGDTSGSGTANSYGIHFGSTSYTLFKGSSYNSSDSYNVVVPLGGTLQFTNQNIDIVFSQLSGKIQQATSEGISDSSNNTTKTMQVNILGVITQVN